MMLERMLFGSRKDRLKPNVLDDEPGLFDVWCKEAVVEKEAAVQETAAAIVKDAGKRREAARKAPSRPCSYQYDGLEERETIVYPEDVNLDDYETIGEDVTRILRYEEPKLFVEVVRRPILRKKSEKNQPSQHLRQAKAPQAVIGGNHVGRKCWQR